MVALWLLSAPLLAFRPDPAIHIGQEPVQIRRYHVERQAQIRNGAGWQSFIDGEGAGWQARFDEFTLKPHRAWGAGIQLDDVSDLKGVEHSLRAFFDRNPDLVGVDSDALVLGKSGHVAHTNTWNVQFDQVVPGTDVTVWRSGVMARVRDGKLVLFGMQIQPIGTPAAPQIQENLAQRIAQAQGPAGNSAHTDVESRLMVLPWREDAERSFPLVWEVRSKTEVPKGHWVSFVDASTGTLLNVHNEVRFMEGKLAVEHDVRTVDGEMEVSALPYLRVQQGEEAIFTDADGGWSFDGSGPVEGKFIGDFLRVHNEHGDDASFTLSGGDEVLTDADASMAELDVYVYQHQVREWALRYAPDLPIIHTRLDAYVNINESCNAYYDGDVNFMRAGSGCNNTGRIADVNYHEWGHGFHYYILSSGVFDGSISEGIGDAVAALQTGDSVISPYFWTSGHGIREIDTNRVYPDDWVGQVHTDGLIFAGAVWDLWNILDDEIGEEAAYDAVSLLLVEAIRTGPEIPDAYDEFIVADDDNADLSDGTPNQCSIIRAFSQHGLGPGGNGSLLALSHDPVGTQAPNVAVEIEVETVNLAPTCVDAAVQEARVVYSTDEGSTWNTAPFDGDDDWMSANLPGQPAGTVVEYYLELESTDGLTARAPTGGEINPFTYFVGELQELYCEDFENDDGEYTHRLISGQPDEGADDWQWGTPIGMGGDPDFAASGMRVWGNDLGGGEYNGEYQNEKHNRLTSRAISVGDHAQLLLQYRRWLNVEDGYYDQANIRANDVVVWDNHSTSRTVGDEHHEDDQWALHSVPIDADDSGSLTLSWEIISDRGLSMGGWNIDDVCVYAITPYTTPEQEPEVNDPDGMDQEFMTEGKITGCACSSADPMNPMGLIGLLLTGLVTATRRRRR